MTAYSSVVRGESVPIPLPLVLLPPPLSSSESMAEQILSSTGSASNGPLSPVNNSGTVENNSDGNVAPPGRPAWKRQSDVVDEIRGFIIGGAASWPDLSESTRPPKLSSDDAKPSGESLSVSQGPVFSQTSQKQVTSTANPGNNKFPVRQRSMKRGSGVDSGSTQTNFNHQWQAPPPFPTFTPPAPPYVPPGPEFSAPKTPYKGYNNWENRPIGGTMSQAHAPNFRNSIRRGNFNSRPRGDHHHQGGGRRDLNHGPRGSGFRDFPVQQQMAPPMSFIAPAPTYPGHFIAPNHVRPFGNPMGFDMAGYPFPYAMPPESFVSTPFIVPAPYPVNYQGVNHILAAQLLNQIEFYFSDDNLVRDTFLRSKMDAEGWVPITLIANFSRIKQMTSNIEFILDSLRASATVEVQGDKIRRRNEWHKWVKITALVRAYSGEQQSTGGPNYSLLENAFQKVTLDDVAATSNSSSATSSVVALAGFSDEEPSSQVKPANEEGGARDN